MFVQDYRDIVSRRDRHLQLDVDAARRPYESSHEADSHRRIGCQPRIGVISTTLSELLVRHGVCLDCVPLDHDIMGTPLLVEKAPAHVRVWHD